MENDLIFAAWDTVHLSSEETFHLEYKDGTLADGETFSDLDCARAVAFDISKDERCTIVIRHLCGGYCFMEELVG